MFSRPSINVFLDFQLAGLDPGAQIGDRAIALAEIVRHDEALHPKAPDDDQPRHPARPGCRWSAIILRDRAAARDPSAQIHLGEAGLENIAADVVEINVDAFGRGGTQGFEHTTPSL